MRTFIAIELPEKVKSVLGKIQEELKEARADVKWVKPQNIHLTLKFLGEVNEGLLKNITSIIDQTSRANSCFNLCLSELGAFPKLKYPRVIWVGITGEGPLIKISEELEKQALSIGLPPEIRAFNSHITLGRVRSGLNREALVEKLNLPGKAACFKNTEFKVSAITLFKSTLTPAGPIYEVISTSPLK